jgi:hypothetical protein
MRQNLNLNHRLNFTIVWPCIITDYLWVKPTDALNSSFISITALHVSGSLSAHHQEFLTRTSALVHFMQLWWPVAPRSRMELLAQVLCPHEKGNSMTETSPEGRPPPTGTIARNHWNATQGTVATIYNFQRYWFLKIKSGSPSLYTSIFQKTARHKMHGRSSPPHRNINIT